MNPVCNISPNPAPMERVSKRKAVISRELIFKTEVTLQVVDFSPVTKIFQHFSRVFRAFLSRKGLVSRRLRRKQGLIESAAGIAMHELTQRRKDGETQSRGVGLILAKGAKFECLRRDAAGDPRDAGAAHEMAAAGVYWFAEAAVADGKGARRGESGACHTIKHNKTR